MRRQEIEELGFERTAAVQNRASILGLGLGSGGVSLEGLVFAPVLSQHGPNRVARPIVDRKTVKPRKP